MGAISDLDQPFRPRQNSLGLGWDENRFSRYDICAEGALPPSITMIARLKYLGYWICNISLRRINFKIEICALRMFYEGDCCTNFDGCFRKLKGLVCVDK